VPHAIPADPTKAEAQRDALDYMGLTPGMRLTDIRIDRVFIGSCTNSRIEDLRAAAAILVGRNACVPGLVSPGSRSVKQQAEQEGLDRIFIEAGIEWGDPGTLQLDADASKVKGLIYAVSAVGSKEVLDRATGKLVPVTKDNAPNSVDGINYAPFAAFGGWAGAINAKADEKKKAAAYAFLSYMNQPAQSNVDVTIGSTGYNPYRLSQLSSTDLWVKAGMPKELADNYLGAINGALNNPNMASDMKIPGAQQYTGVVLDTELARYLAGEITVDEALKNIEEGWEKITEDFGRDEQIKAQALALGL
jgi:hypothetical protein